MIFTSVQGKSRPLFKKKKRKRKIISLMKAIRKRKNLKKKTSRNLYMKKVFVSIKIERRTGAVYLVARRLAWFYHS